MPNKKKSRNKSKKNNKKQQQQQTPSEQNQSGEVSPIPEIKITTGMDTDVQVHTDIAVASDVSTNIQVSVDATRISSDDQDGSTQESNLEAASSVKKKRFSFLKNKKRSSSLVNVNSGETNERMEKENSTTDDDAKVKRAHSISTFGRDEQKSKIPTHKSRQNKKRGVTSSCSNVESTSLVLNPGMDSWRMEGLLGTIEKSNSIHSLNTAGTDQKKDESSFSLTSPLPTPISETKAEEVEMKELPMEGVNKPPKIKETESTPAVKEESEKPEVEVKETENKLGNDFVETNIDFEYSAEIHDDKKKPDVCKEQSKPVATSTPVVKSEAIKESTKETQDSEKAKKNGSVSEPGSAMRDAINDAELYEFDNKSVVTVRNLKDVLREHEMQLPDEIITNDWLILNLTSAPIESF